MSNKDLMCYAKFFVLELEHKKSVSNDETKMQIDSIIEDINNEVIPDILKIKSKNYIIEYGEYLQEYALKNGITLLPFLKMEWKPIYRNAIINDIFE